MQISTELIKQIKSIIANSKEKAIRSVDSERVLMYWQIGEVIFEEEQHGKDRAGYGEFLIKSLAEALQPQFGSGFSIRQLEMCRQFYRVFPIANALRSQIALLPDHNIVYLKVFAAIPIIANFTKTVLWVEILQYC